MSIVSSLDLSCRNIEVHGKCAGELELQPEALIRDKRQGGFKLPSPVKKSTQPRVKSHAGASSLSSYSHYRALRRTNFLRPLSQTDLRRVSSLHATARLQQPFLLVSATRRWHPEPCTVAYDPLPVLRFYDLEHSPSIADFGPLVHIFPNYFHTQDSGISCLHQ